MLPGYYARVKELLTEAFYWPFSHLRSGFKVTGMLSRTGHMKPLCCVEA
jgi:hypothetical protein